VVRRIATARAAPARAGSTRPTPRITPLVTALGMSDAAPEHGLLLFTAFNYRGYPSCSPSQHTRKVIFITAITVAMIWPQFSVHPHLDPGKAMPRPRPTSGPRG
jgi:branched-chain amino acid transport system permease protein